MAKLIYSTNTSLDGFIEDASGSFDWTAPDEEVLVHITDALRPIGTYLFGRRLYETMAVWDTMPTESAGERDFPTIWRAADKVVYSATLPDVSGPRTRLERTFDADAVRAMKDTAARDLLVGGADLAAEAIHAGLVDELLLFVYPLVVGGGKPGLPERARLPERAWLRLELLDERRFASGTVHLRYAIR